MQTSVNNQSMLKVGTILRGIYRIDSYLSSGGFGNTYIATNIEFEERVAIKEFFMKGITQRDGNQTKVCVSNAENQDNFLQQREKFKKEARRLRQLNNSHIVSVHDLFEENGTAYYVMDYVDGESLAERLRRTGKPMTEGEVNGILPQILDALKSVHDAGIWHLDLKPANIMIDKNGQIKLIDFGASKQLNTQKGGATTSTAISYTNGYAPREQMEQNYDKFGPWTDIYALGATLYCLLTAKHPPLPTDIDDDMSKDKHLALPLPTNVSEKTKQMILWMLQPNRNKRPQHMTAIQEKLNSTFGNIDKTVERSTPRSVNINLFDEETIVEPTKKEIDYTTIKKKEATTSDTIKFGFFDFIVHNIDIIGKTIIFCFLFIPLFLFLSGNCSNNANSTITKNNKDTVSDRTALSASQSTKIYDFVEEMPQFPGGLSALYDFLNKNMIYPVEAEEHGIQGRVIVTFVVERDGSVADVKVTKPANPLLNKEAIRVVSSMPNWIPGKQDGNPVRVRYTVPVTFKLE